VTGVDRAAIIGLGLIGGSIARELAERGVHVSGFDDNVRDLEAAVRSKVVHESLDASLRGIGSVDVVVIAVPVDVAPDVLRRVAPLTDDVAFITDVGSTKHRIVETATALGVGDRFVGSHPIAGDHRSGWDASRIGLFTDARVYLCPPADAPTAVVDRARAFWAALGARAVVLPAHEHDQHVAWTSHLPHVVANAVALALANAGTHRSDLGPGGRDVTRLAGSSPEMWAAILRDNGAAIETALLAAEREIAGFRDAIGRDDGDALRRRFAAARDWFAD
jgi:prephenate dehydrogenase